MNNILTKGAASKEYVAENISLKITFKKTGDEANYILGSVMKQCENFIKKLNEINIKPEAV